MSGPNAARRREIRAALVERDGAACWYCGHDFGPDLVGATIDHLIPQSQVRTWLPAALVLACRPCNDAKGSQLPQAFLRPEPGRYGPGLVPLEGAAA